MTLSAEALDRRSRAIGSSDAAAALGLNPHKTPFRLWQEKTGQVEPEDLSDNEAVELGTLLEPVVSELFERRTGKKLHRVNRTIEHPRLPYMVCNIDRRVVGEKSLTEIKTAGEWAAKSDDWGDVGTDAIPFKYAIQVHHQLACLPDFLIGYVPLLVGGNKYRCYEIKRDPSIIEMIERLLGEFWNLVETMTPPAPMNLEQARERWPRSAIESPIEATDEILHEVAELIDVKARAKAIKEQEEIIQGRIAVFMGDHDLLVKGKVDLIKYRTQDRAAYQVKAGTSRPMVTLKGAKG